MRPGEAQESEIQLLCLGVLGFWCVLFAVLCLGCLRREGSFRVFLGILGFKVVQDMKGARFAHLCMATPISHTEGTLKHWFRVEGFRVLVFGI